MPVLGLPWQPELRMRSLFNHTLGDIFGNKDSAEAILWLPQTGNGASNVHHRLSLCGDAAPKLAFANLMKKAAFQLSLMCTCV